mmetsp:Transcript_31259/g.50266  ORF Transcript_31259/g.50266 Transcript_31259/m.50266 type:complete len:84 (-) Transcript_31259:20-271(-)
MGATLGVAFGVCSNFGTEAYIRCHAGVLSTLSGRRTGFNRGCATGTGARAASRRTPLPKERANTPPAIMTSNQGCLGRQSQMV